MVSLTKNATLLDNIIITTVPEGGDLEPDANMQSDKFWAGTECWISHRDAGDDECDSNIGFYWSYIRAELDQNFWAVHVNFVSNYAVLMRIWILLDLCFFCTNFFRQKVPLC